MGKQLGWRRLLRSWDAVAGLLLGRASSPVPTGQQDVWHVLLRTHRHEFTRFLPLLARQKPLSFPLLLREEV